MLKTSVRSIEKLHGVNGVANLIIGPRGGGDIFMYSCSQSDFSAVRD